VTPGRPDAQALLGAVAGALTACEAAGIAVKLKHGIVTSREGYVLPVGERWVARTLAYTPFTPPGDDDTEDWVPCSGTASR
jgi:hypothetical protein